MLKHIMFVSTDFKTLYQTVCLLVKDRTGWQRSLLLFILKYCTCVDFLLPFECAAKWRLIFAFKAKTVRSTR